MSVPLITGSKRTALGDHLDGRWPREAFSQFRLVNFSRTCWITVQGLDDVLAQLAACCVVFPLPLAKSQNRLATRNGFPSQRLHTHPMMPDLRSTSRAPSAFILYPI